MEDIYEVDENRKGMGNDRVVYERESRGRMGCALT
jgi:hypothetical protein